jgi:hypothetical protein
MSEAAERIQVGDERAGQACGWCKGPLEAASRAAFCAECSSPHHEACWDGALGCSKGECFNAPLKRLDKSEGSGIGELEARRQSPSAEPTEDAIADEEAHNGEVASAKKSRGRRKRKVSVKYCIDCKKLMAIDDEICEDCHAINTPDGLYHGPKTIFPGARDAFIISLVGLLLCGPLLGPLAISRANAAKVAIKKDPRLGGEGLATAAVIIGVVDVALWLLTLVSRGLVK